MPACVVRLKILRLAYICIQVGQINVSIAYPPEVVDRGSETQLQVGKAINYLI